MENVILVVHLLIVLALIAVVLLQRSEGGALGMGGGGGSNFMSARGAANALTRTTAILAAAFFATSIALGVLSGVERGSILDEIPLQNQPGSGEGILDQLGGGLPSADPTVPAGDDVPAGDIPSNQGEDQGGVPTGQ